MIGALFDGELAMTPTGPKTDRIGRRPLLGVAAGAMLLGAPMIKRARADAVTINVAGYGGVLNEYLTRVFGKPFTAKTGINVNFGAGGLARAGETAGGIGQRRAVGHRGADRRGIPDGGRPGHHPAVRLQDHRRVAYPARVQEVARRQAVAVSLCDVVGPARDPRRSCAAQLAEFWDTARFKGKRSLYANPTDGSVLEAALLADGVALDKLYPLDIDRALRSLERLGRQNIIWHTTNQEPVQQLTSGAVSLATAFDAASSLPTVPARSSVSRRSTAPSAAIPIAS